MPYTSRFFPPAQPPPAATAPPPTPILRPVASPSLPPVSTPLALPPPQRESYHALFLGRETYAYRGWCGECAAADDDDDDDGEQREGAADEAWGEFCDRCWRGDDLGRGIAMVAGLLWPGRRMAVWERSRGGPGGLRGLEVCLYAGCGDGATTVLARVAEADLDSVEWERFRRVSLVDRPRGVRVGVWKQRVLAHRKRVLKMAMRVRLRAVWSWVRRIPATCPERRAQERDDMLRAVLERAIEFYSPSQAPALGAGLQSGD